MECKKDGQQYEEFCPLRLREEFPVLQQFYEGKPLIYLDNAATMQMPEPVKRRIAAHYETDNANVHRGVHFLSRRTTQAYENARKELGSLLGIKDCEQLVFTAGTTDSINQAAGMVRDFVKPGDEILVTQMEHHSNFLPWMVLAKQCGAKLVVVPVLENGRLDEDAFVQSISAKTKIAAFTQLSNVTGIDNPVGWMCALLKERSDAFILVDGAQGIVHMEFQVPDCDFYCFSGHKLGALTGIGVLYMSDRARRLCKPARYGGGMVHHVSEGEMLLKDGAEGYEAGTPNYVGAISLAEACRFWSRYPRKAVHAHEQALLAELEQALKEIPSLKIIGEGEEKTGCLSFVSSGVSAYDLCTLGNRYGLAVRSGHHCAQPYLSALGVESAARVSVAPYNTMEEIQKAGEIIRETVTFFGRCL